jgi:hypothetical protein
MNPSVYTCSSGPIYTLSPYRFVLLPMCVLKKWALVWLSRNMGCVLFGVSFTWMSCIQTAIAGGGGVWENSIGFPSWYFSCRICFWAIVLKWYICHLQGFWLIPYMFLTDCFSVHANTLLKTYINTTTRVNIIFLFFNFAFCLSTFALFQFSFLFLSFAYS